MDELQKNFGLNLRLMRKTLGITQEELADRVDVDPKQISKLEAGKHFPSARTLSKLCFALDCRLSALFDFDFGPNFIEVETSIHQNRILELLNQSKKIVHDDKKFKLILLAYRCFDDITVLSELNCKVYGMILEQQKK